MGFNLKKSAKKAAKKAKKGSTYAPIIKAETYDPIIKAETYKPIIEAESYEPVKVVVEAESYEPIQSGFTHISMPTIQPVRERTKPKFVPITEIEDEEDEQDSYEAEDEPPKQITDTPVDMGLVFGGMFILSLALFLGNRNR